jgi:outer membrane protein OmpA-like peptidoglycan-associated protein
VKILEKEIYMRKLILASLLCAASAAYAQQDTSTSALGLTREETTTRPQGLLPFIGLGGGYTGYENFAPAEGTPATIKLLGSYYFDAPMVMDLGYGVNNQQFTQSPGANQESAITDGALELALRYRLEHWQLGAIANQLYNQGPNYSADQADATFAGLQALYQFNMTPSWLARVGARAQALTNNTDGQVMMYLVDLQLGWNPGAYKPSVSQNPVAVNNSTPKVDEEMSLDEETPVQAAQTEVPAAAAPSRPVAAVVPEPALRDVNYAALAGGTAIQFQTARASITADDQQKLNQVAKVLADNSDLYERVEVHGYTDSTGSSDANQRISQERANSVGNILKRNGVSDVVAVGKGSAESTGNLASDRRAELVFIGVKDEARLQEALSEVR